MRRAVGPTAPRRPAAQVRELLGEPPPAAAVVDARGLVVVEPRADREPQREPPAGERVDRRGLLGEQRGRPQRADRDHRREPHPLGDGGRRGERGERLDAVVGEPVEHGQARERPGVGAPRPLEHQAPVGAGSRVGKPDADVHACVRIRVQEGLHFTEVMCQTTLTFCA